MSMLDGLISQLETSPIVQKAMLQFQGVRDILVATVNRFDQRFGTAEELSAATAKCLLDLREDIKRTETKLDRVLLLIEKPVDAIKPVGDDGLMKLLAEGGKEMTVVKDYEPLKVCGSPFGMYECRMGEGHEGNHSDQGVEWPNLVIHENEMR